MSTNDAIDYASAGVDTAAGDLAVELMKDAVASSHNATVLGGTGGFAGMVDASALLGMTRPLLATSTDGVGTKIALARAMDVHDTIGQDLVAMVVDDLVVAGARPLLMTDYIACGKVDPQRIAHIVTGIARACAAIDCPLVGGETAEHPGLMAPDEYDIAGAATGVVDEPRLLGPARVKVGDVVIGMASSGLHSNGYSLVRAVVDRVGLALDQHVDDFGRSLGEELLEPTRLYTKVCLDLVDVLGEERIHAYSHVTGGGLAANIARVIPVGLTAVIDRAAWTVPAVFDWVRAGAGASWDAIEDSLNVGIGMVAIVSPDSADEVIARLSAAGIDAWVLGGVHADGIVSLDGHRVTSGTKGVHGGAAALYGEYRLG